MAERDEVVTGSGEAVKRIAAVLVVLLDEQILRPAVQALIDDRLEVEIAFPDLRELNHSFERRPEGLEITCLLELEGVRRWPDCLFERLFRTSDPLPFLHESCQPTSAAS
jgi:hypothetical protein